jgi:hypothetical protein
VDKNQKDRAGQLHKELSAIPTKLAFSLQLFSGFENFVNATLEVEALLRNFIQFAGEDHVEGFDVVFQGDILAAMPVNTSATKKG